MGRRSIAFVFFLSITPGWVHAQWHQRAELYPPPPADDSTTFGTSLGRSGDRLLIGDPDNDSAGFNAGLILDYSEVDGEWVLQRTLEAPAAGDNQFFGRALASSPDWLAASVSRSAPSVEIYERTPDGWTWITSLPVRAGTLTLHDDLLIVGDSSYDRRGHGVVGRVVLFRLVGGEWFLEAELFASNPEPQMLFGASLAIEGETLVVGAPRASGNGGNDGAVYAFENHGGGWTQTQRVLSGHPSESDDWFGDAIAIWGDFMVVGAPRSDSHGAHSGLVYQFRRDQDGNWQDFGRFVAPGTDQGDHLGSALSLGADLLLVGADEHSPGGAVHVFDWAGSTFEYRQTLKADDSHPGAHFGSSLLLDEDQAFVGAPDHRREGDIPAGAVYEFGPCRADLTGDGQTDTLDFLLFLGAWAQGEDIADWDENGVINTIDFLAYLNDWVAGC